MSSLIPDDQPTTVLATLDNAYVKAATSDNTRRAYQADMQHFQQQGGQLPATPDIVVAYLEQCAGQQNPRTLLRRMTALRQWHKLQGGEDPTQHPRVIKTLRGITRLHGQPKRQALALRLADLDKISHWLQAHPSKLHCRNRALLLVGFFGAFRRSELVSLTWEHVQFVSDGMIILLPRSKTDQLAEGERCVIPFGNENRCPVRALIDWRQASAQWDGPIFRRLSKVGTVGKQGLSAYHLNCVIQQLAKDAGLAHPEAYSAHSLRRGFATEAARLGASMPAIQRHGRWKSTKTVLEYIEAGRQFEDSAVKVLFNFD